MEKEAGIKNRIANAFGRSKKDISRKMSRKGSYSRKKDRIENYQSDLKDEVSKRKHGEKTRAKANRRLRKIRNLEDKAIGVNQGGNLKDRLSRKLNTKGSRNKSSTVAKKTFLEEHGGKVAIGAGGTVLGVGGYQMYKNNRKKKNDKRQYNINMMRAARG